MDDRRGDADPFDPRPADQQVETREMVIRGPDENGPDEAELLSTIREALRDAVRVVLSVDVVGPVADAAAIVREVVEIDDEDIESISSEILADGGLRIVAHLGPALWSAEEVVRAVIASPQLQPWDWSVPESADGLATAEWQAPTGTTGIVRIEVNAAPRLGLS
ncbi:hypothetical protein [Micromonospora trifolii]|uniref:hypothetical protein n=1 Tax=Micromonospora trifolii TaxID=2911208 RepID=UPI003CF3082C